MKKKLRYVRVTTPMVQQIGAGALSYQEFCVLTYMLIFAGVSEDGARNPYKLGRKGIADTFQVSDSRVKQVLSQLERKGYIQPLYRIVRADDTFVETESLRRARKMKLSDNSGFMRTFYHVAKHPVFLKKT